MSTLPLRRAAGALAVLAAAALPAARPLRAQVVFSSSGADAAAIQANVDAFRAALGASNGNTPGSLGSGRREIGWDGGAGVSPDLLAPDFFNAVAPRGAVYSTAGTGFTVSRNAAQGNPVFADINAQYATQFVTFSPQRLFTSLGSNVYDVHFFVPGSTAAATTSAFGAVFADVDLANTTSLEFFGVGGGSLGTYFASTFNGGLSFLGVQFAGSQIARVRVTNGNAVLGANDEGNADVVVNDDFVYAEPLAVVPEPGTWALMAAGLAATAGVARRARRA